MFDLNGNEGYVMNKVWEGLVGLFLIIISAIAFIGLPIMINFL